MRLPPASLGDSTEEAAQAYADAGLHVLPLWEALGGACTCRKQQCSDPGKHPRTRKGVHSATNDHRTISRLWRMRPTASIGIATGERSDLLVIDIDPRHDGERRFKKIVAGRELPDTPECLSGGDGRHIYFTYPDTRIGNRPLAPGVDVRGSNGYVVAPPSLHVSGGSYRWDSRVSVQDVAVPPAWLVALLIDVNTLHEPRSRSISRSNPRKPLSAKMTALLEHGDVSDDYPSRSEVIQAITAEAWRQGWNLEELSAVLCDPSNIGGEKVQEKSASQADRYLEMSWETAGRLPPSPASVVPIDEVQLASLDAVLAAQAWTGKSGATDWVVSQALLGIVERTAKTEISASAREVAEMAGVTQKTASKSLRRLQHRGLITLVQPAVRGLAAVYRLQHDYTQYTDTP